MRIRSNTSSPITRGFTLLELLVVLMLLGVITSIALPNLTKLYDRIVAKLALDSVLDQFEAVGRDAYLDNKNYAILDSGYSEDRFRVDYPQLNQFFLFPIKLQDGWAVTTTEPLLILSNGVCLGGDVKLTYNNLTVYNKKLAAPNCHAR